MMSNIIKGGPYTLGSSKLNSILNGMSIKDIVDANSTIMRLRLDLEESDFNFSSLWQGDYKITVTDYNDYIVCNLANKSVSFVNEDGFEIIFKATDNVLQELENDLYEMYYNKEYGIKLLMSTFYKMGAFYAA